jgi:single-strand DNA-binding protein
MSSSVNKVILVGRLGRDPEVRSTNNGTAVCNFTIATDETYKDRSGERQKKTEWHNIVVWGPSVENFVQPHLHKGDLVYIEGKLQTRSWEDKKNGGMRYTTEVNVADIKSLTSKSENSSTPASNRKSKPKAQRIEQSEEASIDDDIPF